MGPQLVANVAFAGAALSVFGVILLVAAHDLPTRHRASWRISVLIGVFLVATGVAGYLLQPMMGVLLSSCLGARICIPLLVWRKHLTKSRRGPLLPTSIDTALRYVVCFATPVEGEGLPRSVAGCSLALLRTGVGPVNAAFALTRFLAKHRACAVIACGVGGAYPGSGLELGDVVCAESETYGDLGAESCGGFLDMEGLGFPVIEGAPPFFNRLPVDLFPTSRRAPFVTCSTCTGTNLKAAALAARTGGAVESMEGAAVVHVARLMGISVGEVRGISNAAGDSDRKRWRVRESAAAARAALVAWIEAGEC